MPLPALPCNKIRHRSEKTAHIFTKFANFNVPSSMNHRKNAPPANKTMLFWIGIFSFFILFHLIAIFLISSRLPLKFIIKIIVDFGVGALLSLPIWYLFFRRLSHYPLQKKLLLHLLVFVIYLLLWFLLQYALLEALNIHFGQFSTKALWWDLYFAGLYYIIVFGYIHAYSFFRQKQALARKAIELTTLAQVNETNALKAQIQPHFLFNTLNSISGSVPHNQEKTRTLIALLADAFRYSLKASSNEVVRLNDELEYIRAILELEKARFGDRLDYSLEVEEAANGFLLAPMLIQPLVENAIQHGIVPCIAGGSISIYAKLHNSELTVSVSNTGTSYSKDLNNIFNSSGIGLKNTKSRLENLYNRTLEVEKNPESGLRFHFRIPSPPSEASNPGIQVYSGNFWKD